MPIHIESVDNPRGDRTDFMPESEARNVHAGAEGSVGAFDPERGVSRLLVAGRIDPLPRRRYTAETVLGPDDRIRIVDTEIAPWRMICALRLRAPAGTFVGTGWFAGPKTLVTAGHCVYDRNQMGGWAESIEVSPGRDQDHLPYSTVKSTRFSTVDTWFSTQDPDFDIGAIHLDEPLGDTLGWFAVGSLPPEELRGYGINVSGYPGDKGGHQQWFHSNRVLHVTDRRIYYDVDTYGGQSGAPAFIYENEDSEPLVVGIHAYGVGGTPGSLAITANSAPRIIPEVVDQITAWVAEDQ